MFESTMTLELRGRDRKVMEIGPQEMTRVVGGASDGELAWRFRVALGTTYQMTGCSLKRLFTVRSR